MTSMPTGRPEGVQKWPQVWFLESGGSFMRLTMAKMSLRPSLVHDKAVYKVLLCMDKVGGSHVRTYGITSQLLFLLCIVGIQRTHQKFFTALLLLPFIFEYNNNKKNRTFIRPNAPLRLLLLMANIAILAAPMTEITLSKQGDDQHFFTAASI